MSLSTSDRDPEFGIGTGGYLVHRAMLGERAVPICVEYEQTGDNLSPLQREAIRQALTLPPVVLQNYEVYREAIGDEKQGEVGWCGKNSGSQVVG